MDEMNIPAINGRAKHNTRRNFAEPSLGLRATWVGVASPYLQHISHAYAHAIVIPFPWSMLVLRDEKKQNQVA